ncbi:amidase [Rhodococcoides fascians]|uniref:amidase n=1 Tax=Rhodococcoides fascians TaxID=1828 RepID=UPI000B9BCFAA|nr:amidase family protein [Rhodococcus fascians]OZE91824.1 amidase [Rhodococcus fascians]OZF22102.1 amidase [Rhodococcus fascians]OZF24291.1 amidase [Rhodococcus fascians]OZF71884.1 amidase [Rhodococcus fascians]OZF73209.1 amidase [Rhodococcus fascians]
MTGDIQSLSLRALAAHIRDREISAREALESHLARIDDVNPVVNAIVTFDIDGATERASAADRATVSGETLPVLHGVPMTHKDNHLTAGLRTTFGSPILADNIPTEDSGIIARLKRAGVNTTGKSNVPEFAAGSHTFNPLFGTTTNPYDPTRSAGGSSGGAAAAIAAGIQPAGDGSDMGGSLRTPGSFCNLVGYRPSLGRIPMLPAKNPWAWIARQGVLAHDIEDVRFLMRALAGPDSSSPRGLPLDDSYRSEEAGSLRGLKVAWTTDFGLGVPVDREVIDVLSRRLHVFEQLGASVDVDCPDLSDADEVFQTTRAFDFATAYGHLLDEHRHRMKSAVQWNVDKGMTLTTRDMISANTARKNLDSAVRQFFSRYDVLIAPAVQVLPFPADEEYPAVVDGTPMNNYLDWMRAASLISATGLPSLSMPGGFSSSGLPVGLQIVTADRADHLLLRVAHAFEAETAFHRRAPASAAATV